MANQSSLNNETILSSIGDVDLDFSQGEALTSVPWEDKCLDEMDRFHINHPTLRASEYIAWILALVKGDIRCANMTIATAFGLKKPDGSGDLLISEAADPKRESWEYLKDFEGAQKELGDKFVETAQKEVATLGTSTIIPSGSAAAKAMAMGGGTAGQTLPDTVYKNPAQRLITWILDNNNSPVVDEYMAFHAAVITGIISRGDTRLANMIWADIHARFGAFYPGRPSVPEFPALSATTITCLGSSLVPDSKIAKSLIWTVLKTVATSTLSQQERGILAFLWTMRWSYTGLGVLKAFQTLKTQNRIDNKMAMETILCKGTLESCNRIIEAAKRYKSGERPSKLWKYCRIVGPQYEKVLSTDDNLLAVVRCYLAVDPQFSGAIWKTKAIQKSFTYVKAVVTLLQQAMTINHSTTLVNALEGTVSGSIFDTGRQLRRPAGRPLPPPGRAAPKEENTEDVSL